MAMSKLKLSLCRIRKILSGDQGKITIGSGCVVSWTLEREASNLTRAPSSCVVLITTTQVVTRNDLISPSTSIVVEFLDGGNVLQFNLCLTNASDIPDLIPGRVLGGTGDVLKDVAFIVIPVEKFDKRNLIKRALSFMRGTSFQKRSLTCCRQSDENLQASILSRKVLCHVIRDGRNDGYYNTEPYCLEFGKDGNNFALTSPLDHDGGDDVTRLKDFHKEEKPIGSPLLSDEGKFVGMLAIGPSDERKLFPLFLPTLESKSTPHTLCKNGWNSQVRDFLPDTFECEIANQPHTSTKATNGLDQTTSDESSRQEENRNNNQNVTQCDEYTENDVTNTAEVQRSGNTCQLPLHNISQTATVTTAGLAQRNGETLLTPPPHRPSLPPHEEEIVYDRESCDQHRGSDSSEGQEDDNLEEISLAEFNENIHELEYTDSPQIRPNLLTQHSCYDGNNLPSGFGNHQDIKARWSHNTSRNARSPDRYAITSQSAKSVELEHVNTGSLVKDTIVSKAKVMDMLALYLDRSVCPGSRGVLLIQRWEHLADEFKVPLDKKRQCENFTGMLSPSENMFSYLCTTHDSLTMKTIKEKLGEMRRNDIVSELRLSDETTVADLCEKHPSTLSIVCLKLDDKRHLGTWQDLGIKLGLKGGTLWKFKNPSSDSPSKTVLRKIETLMPTLRITTLEAAFAEEELNLPAIARVLSVLEDGSTIKTLLDNEDVFDEFTDILDREERYWYGLGQKFKIERKELNFLKPEPIPSPTKVMIEHIVGDKPDLSMKTFLETLVKIKRFDVIEGMKEFFHPGDIEAIVPRNDTRWTN